MNKNLTEIVIVLDESGSMGIIREDTIGGFNTFLKDQKASADGKAKLTLVTFNSSVSTPIDGKDVSEVEELSTSNYRPGGGTALLDAIGETIKRLEDKYTDETDASQVPGKVLFVIITDGEENSSKTYKKLQITSMIKHQTNRHGWEFAFLGANLDSVAEAESLGIKTSNAFNFSTRADHIHDSFTVLSSASKSYVDNGTVSYNVQGTSLEELNKDRVQTPTSKRP